MGSLSIGIPSKFAKKLGRFPCHLIEYLHLGTQHPVEYVIKINGDITRHVFQRKPGRFQINSKIAPALWVLYCQESSIQLKASHRLRGYVPASLRATF